MQFEKSINNFRNIINKNDKLQSTLVPWDWICNNLINLLLEYSDGSTITIIKTELYIKWSNEGDEVLLNLNSNNNNNYSNIDNCELEIEYKKPVSLFMSFKREVIPFDTVIETTIISIDKNSEQKQQQLFDYANGNEDEESIKIHGFSILLLVGDSMYTNQLWLHPKFYSYINEYFGDSPLISPGRRIRFTNTLQQYSNIKNYKNRDDLTTIAVIKSNDANDNNEDNSDINKIKSKKQQQKKEQIIMPSRVLAFILKDIQDLSYSERMNHFKLSSILKFNIIPNETSVLWLQVDKVFKVQHEVYDIKWNHTIPYDNFLGHSIKQIVLLSEIRENWRKDDDELYKVELIFWDELVGFSRLFQKNEKIRLKGVFFKCINEDDKIITLEFLPTSTISILPNNSNNQDMDNQISDISCDNNNYSINGYENKIEIKDLINSNGNFRRSNFSLLARVSTVDYLNYPNEIIVKVNQESDINQFIDIHILNNNNNNNNNNNSDKIEIGQIVYFNNLNIQSNNNNNSTRLIYNSNKLNKPSNYVIVSKIQGILTSKFLYDNNIRLKDLNNHLNSVILATIASINENGESILKKSHSICSGSGELINYNIHGKYKCMECNRIIEDESTEIMNNFNVHYKLKDFNGNSSNNNLNFYATSNVNLQLLQINQQNLEQLSEKDKKKSLDLLIGSSFYFSISKINENEFRIDSCINYQ